MIKQFKINASLFGHPAGTVINLECDEEGTPVIDFWARRLKDAALDNCIEPVKQKAKDK